MQYLFSSSFETNICALFSSSFVTNICVCMMPPKFHSTNKLFDVLFFIGILMLIHVLLTYGITSNYIGDLFRYQLFQF
uniref:Uncharacterized protein n=1 Tax=Arundo donax TaxID=35708 RepID=A0A0A9H600_ARUDO